MEYGEKKYGKDNWRKGQDIPSLCDCAMRHLTAFMDGEELDPESGVSHIGHIMANCMMIVYNQDRGVQDCFEGVSSSIGKEGMFIPLKHIDACDAVNMRYNNHQEVLLWDDMPSEHKKKYIQIFNDYEMIALKLRRGYTPFEQWLKETYNIEK